MNKIMEWVKVLAAAVIVIVAFTIGRKSARSNDPTVPTDLDRFKKESEDATARAKEATTNVDKAVETVKSINRKEVEKSSGLKESVDDFNKW